MVVHVNGNFGINNQSEEPLMNNRVSFMGISIFGAVLINMVKNIAKGKHTSDIGVYDAEGNFDPLKFEEIFQKHLMKAFLLLNERKSSQNTNANALTDDELWGLLKANRVPKDYFNWFLSFFGWKLLHIVGKDKSGLLQKEAVGALYTGELFYQLEQERADK
ncbi:hypothetical protein MKX01_028165 [Papaver californicum]|nr:hypothetical protein MKX01_028165 [Papaver californicum]